MPKGERLKSGCSSAAVPESEPDNAGSELELDDGLQLTTSQVDLQLTEELSSTSQVPHKGFVRHGVPSGRTETRFGAVDIRGKPKNLFRGNDFSFFKAKFGPPVQSKANTNSKSDVKSRLCPRPAKSSKPAESSKSSQRQGKPKVNFDTNPQVVNIDPEQSYVRNMVKSGPNKVNMGMQTSCTSCDPHDPDQPNLLTKELVDKAMLEAETF